MSEFTEDLLKLNIDELVYKMREEAKADNIPTVMDGTFNLLLTYVGAKQPERILEIGAAYGVSGIAMLKLSPKAKLTTIEKAPERADIARNNFKRAGVLDRVNLFEGDASEIVPMLEGKFDFIFLDGPKGHYYEYLPYLMKLLDVGGILFADDVLFWGYIEEEKLRNRKHSTIYKSLRDFLNAVSADERLITTVIEIDDGISVSLRIK